MKRFILFFIALLSPAFSNAQITYQKSYGGIKWEYATNMSQTADSGFIITGSTPRNNNGLPLDLYLLRLDKDGNFLWNKTYGGFQYDEGFSVQQTFDGGYVVGGVTESYGMGLQDAYLMKTDSIGNIQWSKVMGTALYDMIGAVKQTADSGFIFTGLFDGYNGGTTDVYLIKTNVTGDTLWTRSLGSVGSATGTAIQLSGDGGFLITGWLIESAGNRVYLIKTDSLGFPLWAKSYGGSSNDGARDIQHTSDGGYIIVGATYFGAGNTDVYLIKTDSTGNMLWSKTYGGPNVESGSSVQQTIDGGYIISGYTQPASLAYDLYIIKTNSIGDTLWTKTIVGTESTFGGCTVVKAADGGYFITADGNMVPANNFDILLIKTDSLGNSGCNTGHTPITVNTPPTVVWSPPTTVSSGGGITLPSVIVDSMAITVATLCISTSITENINPGETFNIYPNPSNGIFSVSSKNISDFNIMIYNPLGEIVYSDQVVDLPLNSPKPIHLKVEGIFFVKIIFNGNYFCKTIVVEND